MQQKYKAICHYPYLLTLYYHEEIFDNSMLNIIKRLVTYIQNDKTMTMTKLMVLWKDTFPGLHLHIKIALQDISHTNAIFNYLLKTGYK